MATATRTWEGAKALRRSLVPIESLEPYPGNPRRGDVEAVKQSLARFGQVKPVLVDPALGDEGARRIIAGHHVRLAALEMGWTHIAVLENEFADEDEARAFLLADNRLSELGSNDEEQLVAMLRDLADLDNLPGTGYAQSDYETLLAASRRMAEADQGAVETLRNTGKREHRDPSMKEVVLLFNEAQLADFEIRTGIIGHQLGKHGLSEIVFEAVTRVAANLSA